MSEIPVGNDMIPTSTIICIHHQVLRKKPGIVIHIGNGEKINVMYWNEEGRQIAWEDIRSRIKGEYFADLDDLLFRPEMVVALTNEIDQSNRYVIKAVFQWEFDIIRTYDDERKMRHDFGRMVKYLALSKAFFGDN